MASREGGAAGLHLGVLSSLLRGVRFLLLDINQGVELQRSPQRRAGAGGESSRHGLRRLPHMVNRVIVGAHYGMGSWLPSASPPW